MKVTAEDIARLLASSPPRQVPVHVLKATRRGRATWGMAVFGLFFGVFSAPFMAIFFPWRLGDEWRMAAAGTTTTGTVTGVQTANMKVNGVTIMGYEFAYTPARGVRRTGLCFASRGVWSVGAPVTVRYLSNQPEIACIEGARLNQAGGAAVLVVIFPLVGFGMVAWFVTQRGRAGQLLREGIAAEVDILSVEATHTQLNNRRVYKITLSPPNLPGGPPITIRRINEAEIDLAGDRAEKKQTLFVLYDARKPTRLLLPEALIDQ